jgi:hypothetical protein
MTTPPEPGTRLVEEIVLLLQAVAERAGPWLDRVAAAPEDDAADGGLIGALLALARGEPNQQAARYLDNAADMVALVRAVLADRWEPGVIHMPGFRPAEPTTTSDANLDRDVEQSPPLVQRIPVRRGFRSATEDS